LPFTIKENISWVGKVDWELGHFTGRSTHTSRLKVIIPTWSGQKIALINTVWGTFSHESLRDLKERFTYEIDL